jgi:hypothetical protein
VNKNRAGRKVDKANEKAKAWDELNDASNKKNEGIRALRAYQRKIEEEERKRIDAMEEEMLSAFVGIWDCAMHGVSPPDWKCVGHTCVRTFDVNYYAWSYVWFGTFRDVVDANMWFEAGDLLVLLKESFATWDFNYDSCQKSRTFVMEKTNIRAETFSCVRDDGKRMRFYKSLITSSIMEGAAALLRSEGV